MALIHEFAIKKKNKKDIDVKDLDQKKTKINDDLLLYISDSLLWIETKWNDKKLGQGINYYGITIFRKNGILKLSRILECWISLFENAPKRFVLQGSYNLEDGGFEDVGCDKRVIIEELQNLVDLCQVAIKEEEEIIHFGI